MGHIECTSEKWTDLVSRLDGDDVLFIAPGAQKAEMVSNALGDPLSNVSVVTLEGLVREVVDSAEPGVRRINLTATEFMVSSTLKDLRNQLEYLPDVQAFRGVAKAVTRYLIRALNTHPEVVRFGFAAAFSQGASEPKHRDLACVGDELLNRMSSKHVACDDLLKATALDILESGDCPRVQTLSRQHVVLDGANLGTELQWRLLSALVHKASHTHVLGRALANELNGVSSVEQIRIVVRESGLEDRLAAEARRRGLQLFDTRDHEVQGVARRIVQLANEDPGLTLSEIGVVVPNLDRYHALIEEFFPAYGLAFEFVSGFPLEASCAASIARIILSQSRAPQDIAGLFHLFSSGLVDSGDVDVQLVDRIARRFNVSDLSRLRETLDRLPVEYLPEQDELKRLEHSLECITRFVSELQCLKRNAAPDVFVEGLIHILSRLRVVTNAVLPVQEIQASHVGVSDSVVRCEWPRRNAAALSELVDSLVDVRDMFLLFCDREKISFDDMAQAIEDTFRDRRYRCRSSQEAVRVMSPLESRGVDLTHCFVLGLVEGEFPSLPEGGFLSRPAGEWYERRREAACCLLDTLHGCTNTYLSAFSTDGSNRFAISPILGSERDSVNEAAAASQGSSSESYADFEIQTAVGFSLSDESPDSLLQVLGSHARSHSSLQLRMEICRQYQGRGGPYAGEIAPDLLDLRDRVYSVTQLETYLRCPFLYMARYILGIRPLEKVEDELESNEMGSLVHLILAEFGRSGGFSLLKSDTDEARRLLLEKANSVFGEAITAGGANLFVKVQYERLVEGLDGTTTGLGLLSRFVDAEITGGSLASPAEFEREFWLTIEPGHGVGSREHDDSIRITGKVDRIDVLEDKGVYFVVDYKTGRVPSSARIEEGLGLQLPVYLLALKCEAGREGFAGISGYCHLPSAGPVRYSGIFGDLGALPLVLGRPSRRGDLSITCIGGLDAIRDRIRSICADIRSGKFGTTCLDENRAGCGYCEFSKVCRHDRYDSADTEPQVSQGGER